MLWYVGTPYSNYPGGLEDAFDMACFQTAFLAKAGLSVYSPIAHTHPIARYCNVSPTDHAFWMRFDAPLVAACGGLIVVMAKSWSTSRGIAHEITEFKKANKPIVYMTPGCLPAFKFNGHQTVDGLGGRNE